MRCVDCAVSRRLLYPLINVPPQARRADRRGRYNGDRSASPASKSTSSPSSCPNASTCASLPLNSCRSSLLTLARRQLPRELHPQLVPPQPCLPRLPRRSLPAPPASSRRPTPVMLPLRLTTIDTPFTPATSHPLVILIPSSLRNLAPCPYCCLAMHVRSELAYKSWPAIQLGRSSERSAHALTFRTLASSRPPCSASRGLALTSLLLIAARASRTSSSLSRALTRRPHPASSSSVLPRLDRSTARLRPCASSLISHVDSRAL